MKSPLVRQTVLMSWGCSGAQPVPFQGPLVPRSSQDNGQHKAAPWSAAWPWLPAILKSSSTHYSNKEPAAHFSEGQALQPFSCSPSRAGGHRSRVWHRTQASQNRRGQILAACLLCELALQPEHEQKPFQPLQRFPSAHGLAHRVAQGELHTLLPHHSCAASASHPENSHLQQEERKAKMLPLSASPAFPSQH